MFEIQSLGMVPYQSTWENQKELVSGIDGGAISNQLLLLEHPHTITLGRGTHQENLLFSIEHYKKEGVEVVEIDRGGDVTYHGPGQLVGYPIFFLHDRNAHQYLRDLEEVLIRTLQHWGIKGDRKEPYTGVWVDNKKIAAIGIKFNRGRIRRGYITNHGFALNVNTDLSYFQIIVPCGIQDFGVTSMQEVLGEEIDVREVENQIVVEMKEVFKKL